MGMMFTTSLMISLYMMTGGKCAVAVEHMPHLDAVEQGDDKGTGHECLSCSSLQTTSLVTFCYTLALILSGMPCHCFK